MDSTQIKTPCYMIDKGLLEKNLEILAMVKERTGCRILLALKAFAMFSLFPVIREYLDGVCASSADEARLGHEEFKKQVHIYSPAYDKEEFMGQLDFAHTINFNSFRQLYSFKNVVMQNRKNIKMGLRINPEFSEVKPEIYNPCSPCSRLGIKAHEFQGQDRDGISGLLFHTHCEQNADALEKTLKVVEDKFGRIIKSMDWINFGGGHHITRQDYDIDKLCSLISAFMERYKVEVFLEPGEAVVLKCGFLITSVLDIINNQKQIAIMDTSAAAHMPDILEMPYRPAIKGAGEPQQYKYDYRLGGLSCLAGDIIGDYSFQEPLKIGDKLVLMDMAHYTMVKNNTFNGVRLPSIGIWDPEKGEANIIRKFDYSDYKNRLS
ncbi:MAG: carboxynorspermidine decarboxylase [bacterium]